RLIRGRSRRTAAQIMSAVGWSPDASAARRIASFCRVTRVACFMVPPHADPRQAIDARPQRASRWRGSAGDRSPRALPSPPKKERCLVAEGEAHLLNRAHLVFACTAAFEDTRNAHPVEIEPSRFVEAVELRQLMALREL